MGYTPQTWNDNPAGGTPITAARLGVIESGLQQVSTAATSEKLVNPGVATNGLRIPAGVKVRGANIVPKTGQGWPQVWHEWDWSGWIKPQIDTAKTIGANTVRFIGGIGAVLYNSRESGTNRVLTLPQYLANVNQFLTYCAQVGLSVYACGGDFGGLPTGFTQTELVAALQAWGTTLESYSNIIGIDVLQESFYAVANGIAPSGVTTLPAMHTYLSQVAASLRTSTTLPLTFSQPTNAAASNSGVFSDTTNMATAVTYMDFLDFHVYYDPAINDIAPALAYNVPLMIGETGSPMSAGTTARTAHYKAVGALSGHLSLAGVLAWAITDQDTVTTNQWGLYDATFTARPSEVAAFRLWSINPREFVVPLVLAADFSFPSGDQSSGTTLATLSLTIPDTWLVDIDLVADLTVTTANANTVITVYATTGDTGNNVGGGPAFVAAGRSDGTSSWRQTMGSYARSLSQPAASPQNFLLRTTRASNNITAGAGTIYGSRTVATYRFRRS